MILGTMAGAWRMLKLIPWWVWLIFALAAYAGHTRAELARSRAEVAAVELERLNALAAADSTRELAGVLGDTVAVFRRLAVQQRVRADELSRALNRATRARAELEVRMDRMAAALEAPVTMGEADTRRGTFTDSMGPVFVSIAAELPPPPATGRADVSIELAPLELTVDLGCGELNRGVRPADLAVQVGGPWRDARVNIASVMQDPEVCGVLEPVPPDPSAWVKPAAVGAAVGAALVATRGLWWPAVRGLLPD